MSADLSAGLCVDDPEPDLWHSEHPEDVELAKSVCRRCPIQWSCLEGAIERGEKFGVWGARKFGYAHPNVNTHSQAIRAWAATQGIPVSRTGTISPALREAYERATA